MKCIFSILRGFVSCLLFHLYFPFIFWCEKQNYNDCVPFSFDEKLQNIEKIAARHRKN